MNNYNVPDNLLNGKVILITGAGQGIGRSAAIKFAELGATVILAGRNIEKLTKVYDEILVKGFSEALIFPLDLESASDNDYNAMAKGIEEQLGHLDGILHNASQFDNLSPLAIQSSEQFETMFKINVIAVFSMTKACLYLLKQSVDASIIFTSTSAAQTPKAYWGAHAISKAAADCMMRIWADELEMTPNVRINSIIPGALQSPQRKKSHPGEIHSELRTIESVLPLYCYLMGSDSRKVTGQIFNS